MEPSRLIREARSAAGLSQAEVARRARTSQPAIARYEAGSSVPSLATLERILRACRRSLEIGATVRVRGGGATASLARVRRQRERLLQAARRYGVRHVRVFGSVARGDARTDSDVDLLVDLSADRTLLDLIGFKQEAEDILGMRVDAVAPRFLKRGVRAQTERDAIPL
jgi:predicted nucleotidyltransferase/DNA-binding XRE family transcriptional regulator